MICRDHCGACCIAPAITQAIPNMPNGKPAGVACANLNKETKRCEIWGQEDYPGVCAQFAPERQFCGDNAAEALQILSVMESSTSPELTVPK